MLAVLAAAIVLVGVIVAAWYIISRRHSNITRMLQQIKATEKQQLSGSPGDPRSGQDKTDSEDVMVDHLAIHEHSEHEGVLSSDATVNGKKRNLAGASSGMAYFDFSKVPLGGNVGVPGRATTILPDSALMLASPLESLANDETDRWRHAGRHTIRHFADQTNENPTGGSEELNLQPKLYGREWSREEGFYTRGTDNEYFTGGHSQQENMKLIMH